MSDQDKVSGYIGTFVPRNQIQALNKTIESLAMSLYVWGILTERDGDKALVIRRGSGKFKLTLGDDGKIAYHVLWPNDIVPANAGFLVKGMITGMTDLGYDLSYTIPDPAKPEKSGGVVGSFKPAGGGPASSTDFHKMFRILKHYGLNPATLPDYELQALLNKDADGVVKITLEDGALVCTVLIIGGSDTPQAKRHIQDFCDGICDLGFEFTPASS